MWSPSCAPSQDFCMSYLTFQSYSDLTKLSSRHLELAQDDYPGWIEGQLAHWSRWIDARLAKRYAVPFDEPVPDVVKGWLRSIVDPEVLTKIGMDPSDLDVDRIDRDALDAKEEIKEAANSQFGLFDLPLRADTRKSGISKGAPFAYTEASPYVWRDDQARAGRREDGNRGGTFHG